MAKSARHQKYRAAPRAMTTKAGQTRGSGDVPSWVRIHHGAYTPTEPRHDDGEQEVPQGESHRKRSEAPRRGRWPRVVVRHGAEPLLRLPGHVGVCRAAPTTGKRPNEAGAAGVEVISRVRVVGPDGEDECADEGALDPGAIEDRQRLGEFPCLERLIARDDLRDPRPHEPAECREGMEKEADAVNVRGDRERALTSSPPAHDGLPNSVLTTGLPVARSGASIST